MFPLFLSAKLSCQHLLCIIHRLSSEQGGTEATFTPTSNYFSLFTAYFGAVLMESAPSDYLSFRPLLSKHFRSWCLVIQFASAKSKLKANLRCSQFREFRELFWWTKKRGAICVKGSVFVCVGGVSMERGYLRNVNGAIQQLEKIGYWSRLPPSLPP